MTDELEAPDAYDPTLECRVWRKAPRVIGGPSHTHICRLDSGHALEQAQEGYDARPLHYCTCGHTW